QVPEEGDRSSSMAGTADHDRLGARRVSAGRYHRHTWHELDLAVGGCLLPPVADQRELRLDVARDDPAVGRERDVPLGPLRHDPGPREGARTIRSQEAARVVEVQMAQGD